MVVFVVVAVMTVTHIAAPSPQSCSLPAPAPSLPAQLRALGGFDQALDPTDTPYLEALAVQAGSLVAPGLLGSAAEAPVEERATSPSRHDAMVVPLVRKMQAAQPARLVGLVAFLRDCAGRAYYSAVEEVASHAATAPSAFPAIAETRAATILGTAQPQLTYATSPFSPSWRNPATAATIPAA